MSRAASLPGAELVLRKRFFGNKQLVPGSFAARGRTFSQTSDLFFEQATCPRQPRCLGQIFSQKNGLSGILGLLCAEQDVGNLNKCAFRNSGTPVRRTRRRKSPKMHLQGLWDSCAQNKTSEISKKSLSGIPGLPCAEQNVGKPTNIHV